MTNATITVRVPGQPAQRLKLDIGERLVFGRDPGETEPHHVIDHPTVSRTHARLTVEPNAVLVENLRSRHGTRLHGQPITSDRISGILATVRLGEVELLVEPPLQPGVLTEGPAPLVTAPA